MHGAPRTCELGGGVVFTVTGGWTPLHHNQDPPCLRLQGRAAGSTVDKRRWRETWVCIAGIQSWGRGRNGNAESVKLHESPGEGGNGYTAVGKGKREVTARVRCAVQCFVIPFITYLWMLNWQLSSLRQPLISLVLEGGAPPQSFQSPSLPLNGAQHGSKDEVRFLNWISLLCFAVLWTMCAMMQDTSHWVKQEQVVLVWN